MISQGANLPFHVSAVPGTGDLIQGAKLPFHVSAVPGTGDLTGCQFTLSGFGRTRYR